MLNTIYGFKLASSQRYTASGKRIPVTMVRIDPNIVIQVKSDEKDGYKAVQFVVGAQKNISKPVLGKLKKAAGNGIFRRSFGHGMHIREASVGSSEPVDIKIGDSFGASLVLKAGDLVNVTATSRGKGFAGVVKRHGFAGGPKTHGQSDRHRAPGSIGQTTTPGRVLKGKKMAGRMGGTTITMRNLVVMDVAANEIIVKGTISGAVGSLSKITKVGEMANFVPIIGNRGLDKQAVAADQEKIDVATETPEEEAKDQKIKEEEKA